MKKILLFDNYDSFTYNLKALLKRAAEGYEIIVKRNSDRSVFETGFDIIVVSPGPMTHRETGVLKELFEQKVIPENIPILGICLGFQFLAEYYGVPVGRIENPVHGSQVTVVHENDPLFIDIPNEFVAARYNSLGCDSESVTGNELIISAFEKESGSLMALRHSYLPFAGFQFHPESFLTDYGEIMIKNFMKLYV